MIYGRAPLPLLLLTPESNAMDVTSCSSQGLDKTTSNMVSLTNVFYLSTINNVAVKREKGNAIHTKPSGGMKLQGGTLNLTFIVIDAQNHSS